MVPLRHTNPLHAAPDIVARIAEQAHAKRLIVSHVGLIGPAVDAAVAEVKKSYLGPLTVGADLQCTAIRG
jgi:ribonuclease BN (tRNA processing enzyme)